MESSKSVEWQRLKVSSPHLDDTVDVIVAKDIPYVSNPNRLQNLSIYALSTPETLKLVGKGVTSIPGFSNGSGLPLWHVHVHGGAWRDPQLGSTSIEADVAHAFSSDDPDTPLSAIISINYTLSPFPTHPTLPYDPGNGDRSDPAREGLHPVHVHDVLSAFSLLRTLGLSDDSYILSGHSCGACLAFQSTLQPPQHWGFGDILPPPRPAVLIGFNGLYDLPHLVHGLGQSHSHLQSVYEDLIDIAFGSDQSRWPAASPARVDTDELTDRVQNGPAPRIVWLDQSTEDQLVPMNQTDDLASHLAKVAGMKVLRGKRCTGKHAAPWEEGIMIWQSVQDIFKILRNRF